MNGMENHLELEQNQETLDKINSQETATDFVLNFLKASKIEFYFDVDRTEDADADDMLTYVRDFCSRLVLSLAIDTCEKAEDPLGLRAIRRIMVLYFLNRKCKVQDSKVSSSISVCITQVTISVFVSFSIINMIKNYQGSPGDLRGDLSHLHGGPPNHLHTQYSFFINIILAVRPILDVGHGSGRVHESENQIPYGSAGLL